MSINIDKTVVNFLAEVTITKIVPITDDMDANVNQDEEIPIDIGSDDEEG